MTIPDPTEPIPGEPEPIPIEPDVHGRPHDPVDLAGSNE
jgi:hypothetical protein